MKVKEIPGEGHWRAAFREEPGISGCARERTGIRVLRKAEATERDHFASKTSARSRNIY